MIPIAIRTTPAGLMSEDVVGTHVVGTHVVGSTRPIALADGTGGKSGGAYPFTFEAEWSGGTLLLASDGRLKYAPLQAIYRIAREADLAQAAQEPGELVRLRSGVLSDDVSAALCRQVR